MTAPLYRRLLGGRFDQLPARVRELHDFTGTSVWVGRADVERGTSWMSRLLATLLRLPRTGDGQVLRVTFRAAGDTEIWERSFDGAVFRSVQDECGGLMRERVGPSMLVFALDAASDGLALKLRRVHAMGIPLPRMLLPAIVTLESERDGRYCFDVKASLPMAGLLVRYSGWLERQTGTIERSDAAYQ